VLRCYSRTLALSVIVDALLARTGSTASTASLAERRTGPEARRSFLGSDALHAPADGADRERSSASDSGSRGQVAERLLTQCWTGLQRAGATGLTWSPRPSWGQVRPGALRPAAPAWKVEPAPSTETTAMPLKQMSLRRLLIA
jgi:hypothetical protein